MLIVSVADKLVRNFKILGGSVLYRVGNLPVEKVCIIQDFEEANFSTARYDLENQPTEVELVSNDL